MQLSETNPFLSSSQSNSLSTRLHSLLTQNIPKCSGQRYGFYICINRKCQIPSPFICVAEQCLCSQHHEFCQQIKLKSFVKIFEKKNQIKLEIQEKINSRTDQIIDKISDFRDDILKKIRQSEVYNMLGIQYQKELTEQNEKLMLLTKIKENDLTGALMAQIWQADQKINEQKKLSQIMQNIDKTFDHLKSNLKKDFSTMFNKVRKNNSLKIYWSPQLKGLSQEISGKIVKRLPGSFMDISYTLLQPSLTKMKANIVTWQMTALNTKEWAGFGICIKSIIKKYNFDFKNYTQAEHGSYVISSNGYSWSHKNPHQNSVANDITITSGDKIDFEMNFMKSELKYTNQTSNMSGKINVVSKDLNEDDEYYICSLLRTEGDQIKMGKIEADGVQIEWIQ